MKFIFPSFLDISLHSLSEANSQNFGIKKSIMADLWLFEVFADFCQSGKFQL